MLIDTIIRDVRTNRERVLTDAGGYEKWVAKAVATQERLKADGWTFATGERPAINIHMEHTHPIS